MTDDLPSSSGEQRMAQRRGDQVAAAPPSSDYSFPSRVRYRNIGQQIAATIRGAIAAGSLPFGSRLLEAKIAREMGTSRGPVREALFQLEREGLVCRTPNRETSVIGLTEEVVQQIASLRGVLEGFAAQLAVSRLTADDLGCLESILTEMSAMARGGNFEALVECDYRFHEHVVRASGHYLLHEIWIGLERRIRIYLSALNRRYGDLHAVVRGHARILRALRRRETKHLNRMMTNHMLEALELTHTQGRQAACRRTPVKSVRSISGSR